MNMKFSFLLFVICGALIASTDCIALNDNLWLGAKYSVAVKYLGVDEKEIDVPFPKSMQMPSYPIEAMKAGVSADIVVSFVVNEKGSVEQITTDKVKVVEFSAAVKDAVAHWSFYPSVLLSDRGKVVSAHMRCRFEFRTIEGKAEL